MKNIKYKVSTTSFDGNTGLFPVIALHFHDENSIMITYDDPGYGINKELLDEGSLIPSTGLKDKYGKDIYLGDKVRWTKLQYTDCSRTEVEGTEITEGIVDWMDTTLVLKKDGHAFFLWPTAIGEPNELEIIGNIYEFGEVEGK
ncbi:YopX family protein [Bacillus cereus]|uniref:YopX family protein n=1 Tax=Bacillus cereus TaxID=1396 RepID=UPI000BF830CE|nr:YopX family protein [Bacillus cereus]PEY75266.1 hypothetical protein CN344_23725 [Bacillus cereus]PFO79980.1 hypothetical protein COJ87_06065 [Bacillus cereus]PGP75256.1 hypothetical protein CN999_30990 [Bacillus cereus]PGU79518.1 hypothetical protein COD68_26285 [Bacillus cereus]